MAHKVEPRPEFRERGLDIGQQGLCRRGEADPPALTDEQLGAHHRTCAGQGAAHGGLRNAQQFGGFGDVLRAAQFRQDRQDGQQLDQLPVLNVHDLPAASIRIRCCMIRA